MTTTHVPFIGIPGYYHMFKDPVLLLALTKVPVRGIGPLTAYLPTHHPHAAAYTQPRVAPARDPLPVYPLPVHLVPALKSCVCEIEAK